MALGQAILVASDAVTVLLQQAWAEVDDRFDVRLVTEGRLMTHANKKLGYLLFPSVGCLLKSLPPFKCSDFKKCVGVICITLYNDSSTQFRATNSFVPSWCQFKNSVVATIGLLPSTIQDLLFLRHFIVESANSKAPCRVSEILT